MVKYELNIKEIFSKRVIHQSTHCYDSSSLVLKSMVESIVSLNHDNIISILVWNKFFHENYSVADLHSLSGIFGKIRQIENQLDMVKYLKYYKLINCFCLDQLLEMFVRMLPLVPPSTLTHSDDKPEFRDVCKQIDKMVQNIKSNVMVSNNNNINNQYKQLQHYSNNNIQNQPSYAFIVNINNNVNFNNLLNHYNHLLNQDKITIIKLLYRREYESLLKYIHKHGSIQFIPNFNISNYIQLDIPIYWFSTFYHLFFKFQLNTSIDYIPMFYINSQVLDFLWSIKSDLMASAFIQLIDSPSFNSNSIPPLEYILKNKMQDVLNLNLNDTQISNLFNNSLLYGTLHTWGLLKSVFSNFNFKFSSSLIINLISVGYSKLQSLYFLFQINALPNLLNLIGESNISRIVIMDTTKLCCFRNSIPVLKDMFSLIYKIIKIQNNNYNNKYLDRLYNSINK